MAFYKKNKKKMHRSKYEIYTYGENGATSRPKLRAKCGDAI